MLIGWTLVALAGVWLGFAYLGYPLLLMLLARLRPRPLATGAGRPSLSVVIAVHDGGERIEEKLKSTLALRYPEPFEVIVASDGSTDETDRIAESFAGCGVVLVRSPERRGKEAVQAAAIARADGEVLVFTDLGAELEDDALLHLVEPFADPGVGCVSSEDVSVGAEGEGAYVRYEMALRRLETRAASLIGVSGSCFAIRRSLCEPWPTDLASDFRSALECARRGLRAVSEPRARARIPATRDAGREWTRKVRTVRRGLAVLFAYRDLLRPGSSPVWLPLWGHKVARFTSPVALLGVLLGSLLALPGTAAQALLAAQALAYGLGAAALAGLPGAGFRLARLCAYFLLVNASILVAWIHHARGERAVVWTPTRR